MSESADRATEAAQWFTVMTRGDIAPEELERFRAWRRAPENAAAFDKVKRASELAGSLAERPAIAALTDATLAKYPARPGSVGRSRRFVLAPLAVGLAGLAGVSAIVVWREAGPTYATQVGGQRLEVLADGSRVRLNTDSKVRVEFREAERRVTLERGQAYFDVAHDAARPFVVVADGVRVRALGTAFDVRRDADQVRVTLLRGRVQVRGADGSEAVLTPGEAVAVGRRGVPRPTPTDAGAVTSWTTGRITLSGVPLREAVAEVNRYSARKVVLEAPESLAEEKISGQFVAGDIDNFVAGATSLYGLKVASQTAREIRLAPG